MTVLEAFNIISKQLQKNDQNKKALAIILEAAEFYEEIVEDDDFKTYTMPEIEKTMEALSKLTIKKVEDE
jgi:5,10-methylenetetrahydrofolate reductase